MKLTPIVERYILHWGEMGTRWGVNRSIAQIHALLYLSPEPMTAEEIAETLSVARSNVSTSLRELVDAGLVNMSHEIGDRRDRFSALQDNWDLVRAIVEARKRREIDPTLTMLRAAVLEADQDKETDPRIKARIAGMLDFMEMANGWYQQMRTLPRSQLLMLIKLGAKVVQIVAPLRGRKKA